MSGSTIVKPPPEDPAKSPIENVVEVTELTALGPVRTTGLPPLLPLLAYPGLPD